MASLNEIVTGDKKSRDVIDLSFVEVRDKSELKRLLEKIPDFKARSERVRVDDLCVDDETGGTLSCEKIKAKVSDEYQFSNPIPSSLREVNLKELGRVNISWKMLTLARPKTKLEEDFFTRMMQLEKLQYKTIQWEMDKEALKDKKGSSSSQAKSRGNLSTNRGPIRGAAVAEMRLQTCKECGVEFCVGLCKNFLYEDFARTFNPITEDIFEIARKTNPKSKKGVSSMNLKKSNFEGENDGKCSPEDNEKKKNVTRIKAPEHQLSTSKAVSNLDSSCKQVVEKKRAVKVKSRQNKKK